MLLNPYTKIEPRPCACPLNFVRRVGGRGKIDADLVFIGEAPGTEELKDGIPFVGPSGEMVERVLPQGFDHDSKVLWLNAMQCRPPKTKNQNKDKENKAKCTKACQSRLWDIVWEHPRKAILCMGNWAVAGLTSNWDCKITKVRGEIVTVRDPVRGIEVPVVMAVHPAFLLRGSGNPNMFREDVRKSIELAYGEIVAWGEGGKVVREAWQEPEYREMEDANAIRQLCNRIAQQGREVVCAADFESEGLDSYRDDILQFGVYPDWDDNIAHGINWDKTNTDPEYKRAVEQLIALPNVRWLWQNGKFDMRLVGCKDIKRPETFRVHEDTLLLHYALTESGAGERDIETLAKNFCGAPMYADEIWKYLPNKRASWRMIPRPVLTDYWARDVKRTYHVWRVLRDKVRADANLEKLYTRTLIPASKMLVDIELKGIQVDWDYVRINKYGATPWDVERGLITVADWDSGKERGLLWELDQVGREINEIAGEFINPNSPDQVASLLYDRFALTIKGKRPTDTRKETLDKLPNHPAVKKIRQYRRLQKMLSTYVTAIEQRALWDRVHTTFNLARTTTGRLSSQEPNIQNIPREPRFKRMYRAKPGYVLIESDYNTAELRMLAALSGDKFLTGVFLDGKRNLHDEVSIAMYGHGFTPDQRIRAKAINFGIPYGREAFSIAEEFDISKEEAQRLIDAWFARAPEAAEFIKQCRRAPLQNRTLITAFGRKRRPGVVSFDRLKQLQNEFANFPMQSPVSDFTLHTGILVQDELAHYDSSLVNLVHDSTLAEVPDDPYVIREVCGLLKEVMEEIPTGWIQTPIRFVVDQKVGTHWGHGMVAV